jgi:hypothetical protein
MRRTEVTARQSEGEQRCVTTLDQSANTARHRRWAATVNVNQPDVRFHPAAAIRTQTIASRTCTRGRKKMQGATITTPIPRRFEDLRI